MRDADDRQVWPVSEIVTPALDAGVHSAFATAWREACGMDGGVKRRHDGNSEASEASALSVVIAGLVPAIHDHRRCLYRERGGYGCPQQVRA